LHKPPAKRPPSRTDDANAALRAFAALALIALPLAAAAADFRATADPATVMYDAPSARAKPLYVYGRDIPVETLVAVEGWTKIRDASGTIGWVQSKMLSDRRMVVVRTAAADVRAAADDGAPVVFRADRDVLLEIAEPAATPSTTSSPGWLKVRHRDGDVGYVRLSQVFGL